MPKYSVKYYQTRRGQQPIISFFDSLDDKSFSKCDYYIKRLQEEGLSLSHAFLEKVETDLWTLRPEWGGVEFRLFFTILNSEFVFVHAVKKKSGKLKEKDITLARQRVKEVQGNASR